MPRINRDRLTAVLMLTPSIILVAVFVYGFIAWTGWTSLTDTTSNTLISGQSANYIGGENYAELFSRALDKRFRADLVNTVFFTIMFIIACLGVGMGLAILLDQKVKGENTFRTIFLFPMALSFVVTGVVWRWLFNPENGINSLPTLIGLPAGTFFWHISDAKAFTFLWQDVPAIIGIIVLGIVVFFALRSWAKQKSMLAALLGALALLTMAWLSFGNPSSLIAIARPEEHSFRPALLALVLAAGWQMSGYTMAMYLAGLRGVSDELREAARVDGATELGVYRHVILPLLAPITLSAMIILGHISLKIFDLVYTMGGGDNLYIDMPGMYMYMLSFRGTDVAKGAGIATIMLVMVAVVIVPYLITQLRSEKSL
ncbi:MAG: sugar ABC transporter permease [Chloroflexi bacterium]|uniref:carbohydrate ABC transporter permease n=1 Tax=Candidatus Flexifilum breve TaxID=3140694 RepID=UPI003135A862|nr:sugar ABC transporter permease [Chloroflexota bacterium]MBK9747332.1 sugar ABC transporter permease [Chloroflexota bacterium]